MRSLSTRSQLDSVLELTPVVYEGEPLLLAELDDVVVEIDVWEYVRHVDSPTLVPIERTVLLGPATSYFDRWPILRTDAKMPANLTQFNLRLFQNYERVQRFAFTQSDIVSRIEEDLETDVILLLLIDGLSYIDWMDYPGVQSCLVTGPTITPVGFRNVVGTPPVARRLFDNGFQKRIGFSHWDRDNNLTNDLFYGFDATTQMIRVNEFREILLALESLPQEQTYIQVLINGLDSICHRHRGRPPVEAFARDLYENKLMALAERLHKIGVTALVYATADHGILWKPEVGSEDSLIVLPDPRTGSRRYAKGSLAAPHSLSFNCYGTNYTALAYPYLYNSPTSLEWGFHGGISFQESVVPFVKVEVL